MQGMEMSKCGCFESRLTFEWFDDFEYDKEKNDVSSIGLNTQVLQRVQLEPVAMDKQSSWQQIRVAIRSEISFIGNNEAKSQ